MLFFKKPDVDWLIVGLGNPDDNYANTRHNAGFRAIEALASKLGVSITRKKFRGLSETVTWQGQKLVLLKPLTYMNNSGLSVMDAVRFYKIPPERVIVLFDDISLPVGRMRIRGDGSAGGHNGIKSIIGCLNSQSFPRVKIGVGAKPHPDYDLASWVLSTFRKEEEKLLVPTLDAAADAVLTIISSGIPVAVNSYNGFRAN